MATKLNIPGEIKSSPKNEFKAKTEELLKGAMNKPVVDRRVGYVSTQLNNTLNSTTYMAGIDPYQQSNKTSTPFIDTSQFQWQYPLPGNNNAPYPHVVSIDKDPMEVIMDSMFNEDEKIEYLKNLGTYEEGPHGWFRPIESDTPLQYYNTYFYKEMKIKFKNLLLSKQALKIKI